MSVSQLFDPRHYDAVRRPLLSAQTLPPACYSSPEFYHREVANIFVKKWNLVARLDFLPNRGDYLARTLVGVPFLLVHGHDGQIRGFANTCRHRGAQLLDGEGSCERIVCPYHSWTYETDGRLAFANGMEETDDFDLSDYGLVQIRLEIWHGFVFVNFDSHAPELSSYLGDLEHFIDSYDFDNMVTVKRDEYLVRTNWKSYVENSMEAFHHPTVHRDSVYNPKTKKNTVVGDPGHYVLVQSDAGGATRAVLKGTTGFPSIATLRGAAAKGAQYILIYPCTMLGCDVDSMWFKQMMPEGPDHVRNIVAVCFPRETVARDDFEEVSARYFERLDVVVGEDNDIAERQFLGLSSPLARAGRFSHREPLVHVIDNWILDQVLDPQKGL